MDPDMVRQQFEEEAEVKRRGKSSAQPAGTPSGVIPPAVSVAAVAPEPPAPAPAVTAIAIPPRITPVATPPGGSGAPPAVITALESAAMPEQPPEPEATIARERPAEPPAVTAALETAATPEQPPEPAATIARELPVEPPPAITAALEHAAMPEQPSEPPATGAPDALAAAVTPERPAAPKSARRAYGGATAAFAYIAGALAGQALALASPPVPAVEPFRVLILAALYGYVCAFLAAAALSVRPVGVRRPRFYTIHSGGALIAAAIMEAALIVSGLFNSGYGGLARTETWTAYTVAASTAFAILWPLTHFRMKRAARHSVRTEE